MQANQSQISLELWQNNWVESKNKIAEVMFPNWLEFSVLVLYFSSHNRYSQSYIAHVTIFSGLSRSVIPHFSKN